MEDKFEQVYNLIQEIADDAGATWLEVYASLLVAHAATNAEDENDAED